MTKLQTLAVAACMMVGTIASAQTSISKEEGISDELTTYLTVEEMMAEAEKNIKTLTDELLAENDAAEKDAIRTKIKSEQKTLIELKRENEERKSLKAGNRSMTLFEGDLTRNDLRLKSFSTNFNSETDELTISFRSTDDGDAKITLLTPGKEIVHQMQSTTSNSKHKVSVDLSGQELKTFCVHVEANGKTITKMITL
jgi:hypothetical protein